MGTAAPVAVGQSGGAALAVGGQHPSGVALGHAQQLGGIGDGGLVFQNGVEHGESGLFFLVQRNVLHQDIFADQLVDDGIVEQQQFSTAQTRRSVRPRGTFSPSFILRKPDN